MITLFELKLELLAMLIAPLMAPAVVWLAEWALAARRQRPPGPNRRVKTRAHRATSA
jgi:hypothetical protein